MLKDGRGQGTFPLAELTPSRLINLMVGRDVNPHQSRSEEALPERRPVLQVRNLSDPASGRPRKPRLENVSFDVHAGEIVGLAGLVGAGRSETAMAPFGARPGCTGEILVDGKPVRPKSPAEAIAAGIGYLTEDRKLSGLFLERSIADNLVSAAGNRFAPGGIRSARSARRSRSCAEHCAWFAGGPTSRSRTSAAATSRR